MTSILHTVFPTLFPLGPAPPSAGKKRLDRAHRCNVHSRMQKYTLQNCFCGKTSSNQEGKRKNHSYSHLRSNERIASIVRSIIVCFILSFRHYYRNVISVLTARTTMTNHFNLRKHLINRSFL